MGLGHYSKDCWSKKNTNKGGSNGKHKPKNAIVELLFEIDEFNMTYLNVDALQQESEKMRGSEWTKIGVVTGVKKTAWPRSFTYRTRILGDSDPTFRKKVDAWIQEELRDSQYRGCTVVSKENNVYNIYMELGENNIDAMPLSGDSDLESCRPGQDRRIQIQTFQLEHEIQKFEEVHTIQCEWKRWMVMSTWCRGCPTFLLNPVQDKSPNTS